MLCWWCLEGSQAVPASQHSTGAAVLMLRALGYLQGKLFASGTSLSSLLPPGLGELFLQ